MVAGGSAPSTPHFLTDVRLAADAGIGFALHGRSARRLDAVRRAAVLLEPRLRERVVTTTVLDDAVADADLVVVQVRAGGLAARAHDERFPPAAGIPGDEGLGPGGLAAAWRAWPLVHGVLATIARRAPRARIALLTAPLGILVRCALETFPALDVAGLCELPAVILGEVRAALGAPRELAFRYAGVNHLGWFTELSVDGRDAMKTYAATREGAAYPSADVIRTSGGVPLPYVRLQDERDAVVAAQRAGTPRAAALAAIADAAFDAFEHGDAAMIRAALARRPAPWYPRAVAPWVRAHRDGMSDDVFFLTVRNAGYLADFPADAVVEVPHRMRGGAFVADAGPRELPMRIARSLATLVAYEARAAAAVAARDASAIPAVLAAHPWVADASTAASLARDVLAGDAAIASFTAPA